MTMTAEKIPVGMTMVAGTAYKVYDLGVGENAKRAGIRGNYALEGPRGAQYFVTDHGPKFRLNVVAMGGDSTRPNWRPSPTNIGNLRHLKREDLSAFGVEVSA
jgi:hypothetical protein